MKFKAIPAHTESPAAQNADLIIPLLFPMHVGKTEAASDSFAIAFEIALHERDAIGDVPPARAAGDF